MTVALNVPRPNYCLRSRSLSGRKTVGR